MQMTKMLYCPVMMLRSVRPISISKRMPQQLARGRPANVCMLPECNS